MGDASAGGGGYSAAETKRPRVRQLWERTSTTSASFSASASSLRHRLGANPRANCATPLTLAGERVAVAGCARLISAFMKLSPPPAASPRVLLAARKSIVPLPHRTDTEPSAGNPPVRTRNSQTTARKHPALVSSNPGRVARPVGPIGGSGTSPSLGPWGIIGELGIILPPACMLPASGIIGGLGTQGEGGEAGTKTVPKRSTA
ncbi:hypothetical protein I7I51_06254 [Histoplasma capsulatum]|uniref:Uncharacterized protein n=1 Tax=Ajellomyces capsulatus TaxID=5037 RepID=A0A8A1MHD0_AJECA|nr:hypothetical protein I7I51_06254 [Histoplasma capsulatum]